MTVEMVIMVHKEDKDQPGHREELVHKDLLETIQTLQDRKVILEHQEQIQTLQVPKEDKDLQDLDLM